MPTKYGVYNYVDTPDMTMNELVSQVRAKLKGRNNVVSFTLLAWNNLGEIADIVSALTEKTYLWLHQSEKFASSTEFRSAKNALELRR